MKKALKFALASLALAAVVAGSPLFSAPSFAEEAQVIELQDGTKVQVDGENVSVVGADGTTTPAPDGTHTAKDGSTITTKDGKLVK